MDSLPLVNLPSAASGDIVGEQAHDAAAVEQPHVPVVDLDDPGCRTSAIPSRDRQPHSRPASTATPRRRGLTLAALATRADISISFLADIEHDRTVPSLERLQRIAEALELDTRGLLHGVERFGEDWWRLEPVRRRATHEPVAQMSCD